MNNVPHNAVRDVVFILTSLSWLLQPQKHLPLIPQFFQFIVLAQIAIEYVDDDIPIINDDPAAVRRSFNPSLFIVLDAGLVHHSICKGMQHAVAGGSTDNKEICKVGDLLDIQQENIFSLLFFKGINDRVCKFQGIQSSPHKGSMRLLGGFECFESCHAGPNGRM